MSSTSGRANSGVANYTYFYFQWQLASQNIAGNYSTINWQWGVSKSGSATATWYSNAIKSVDGYINGGQAIGGNTWSNITVGGDVQLLSGSWDIGHNTDGTKNFGISSTGWLYSYGNYSNSGSWDLPTIPRHATLTALSMDSGGITAYDEGPMWVEFNNPAGTAVDSFIDDPSGRAVTDANSTSRHNYTFNSALINHLQASSPNSNTFNINIGIHDSLGGDNYDYRTRTVTIKNDTGQANPIFSTFTYADSNSTTATLTGNNQYLIQGQSTLQVTVPLANKATPQKYATMSHYTVNIGGYSNNLSYSSSADAVLTVGSVSDVTGVQTISTRAVDSRGNGKLATLPVTIIPYIQPTVNATAIRANGYDDALILKINGVVSPVTISSVDKNTVNATSGVQYRYITDGADITGVSWTNVANTQTSGTGAIAANDQGIIVAATGTASSAHSYQVQVRIVDGLYTTTQTISVPTGQSIFRIGTDRNVYFKEVAYQNNISIVSSGTPQASGSASLNTLDITALAAAASFSEPTGTPTDNNRILYHIKDNGTARALTWPASHRSGDAVLPTTTVAGKNLYVGVIYNATDAKWDCITVMGNY